MISFGQAETAAMTFDKTIHDFGGVMKGDVVMTTFKLMKTIYYSFILNSPLWFDGLQLWLHLANSVITGVNESPFSVRLYIKVFLLSGWFTLVKNPVF